MNKIIILACMFLASCVAYTNDSDSLMGSNEDVTQDTIHFSPRKSGNPPPCASTIEYIIFPNGQVSIVEMPIGCNDNIIWEDPEDPYKESFDGIMEFEAYQGN